MEGPELLHFKIRASNLSHFLLIKGHVHADQSNSGAESDLGTVTLPDSPGTTCRAVLSPVKVKVLSHSWQHTLDTNLYPWNSPGKDTGVGGHSLLQGIFLIQGSNPGLPHCRQILYHLSTTREAPS